MAKKLFGIGRILPKDSILSALAELRRDDLVDDAVVEGVAGDADAGVAERARAHPACDVREPHDGEIAGAAAEVGDQHDRILAQPLREEESRADRLVDMDLVAQPEPLEGRPVARGGERVVGIAAGEADRPSDHDAARAVDRRRAGIAPQRAEERRQQILEFEALAEDARVLERAARREGLERLDEAMRAGALEELLDRPRPALDARLQRAVASSPPRSRSADM